jgi:predicted ATPase
LPEERSAKFPPEELRRRQLAAVTAWYFAGARTQPAVLVFEDLHWADPTSLDLLRSLAERGAQAPLLIVATTRPEFRPPWAMRSHHGVVSLAPLDRAQVRRMVGEIASRHALSDEMIDGVGERSGGVPLFVEEVTRLLLERNVQGGAQAIPPTLQQSLAARLDRLGEAREAAQIGAVLGRDFSYRLLSDVSSTAAGVDELRLQAALDRLIEADLLFVDGAPPTAAYRFKHALIQDAAYESLLKSRRQALHRRAAEILRDDPERAASEPEVIAHHFTQGGLDDLAIEWWGRAGDQALRRSAFQEAIAHLGKAVAMADKAAGAAGQAQATGAAAPSRRLKLQTDYGQAVMWSKGFAAEETKAAFARAAELTANSDDFSERFATLHGQWTLALVRSELHSARELASAFLREAEDAGRVMEAGVARRGLALISYYSGDFVEARTHCERALAACDPERDKEARERSGEDTGAVAMSCLAMTAWQLGEVERAREMIEVANRRASEIGHVPSLAHPLFFKSYLEILRSDAAAALGAAEALEALGREHGMAQWRIMGELLSGWARGRLHDRAAGAAELRRALAALADQGARMTTAFDNGLLAELEVETLGADSGLARIDDALALAHRVGNLCDLAFLHRLRGEILLKRDPANPAPAEEAFQTAIAVAREQGARSLGLRAALSLARLYQSTARPADAHAILAPALEGFSPTPEMPEIAEAQALLVAIEAGAHVRHQ